MADPCCDAFVRLHSNIGRRGFAIRTETTGPGVTKATLHFNAVPAQDEAKLAETLKPARIVVQSNGLESIRFCPFCGARLGT